MKVTARRTVVRHATLALLLTVAGCGGDGNGTGGPAAASTNVTISNFSVRPLTSVLADRPAQLQITVTTSDPDSFVGARAVIRQLGAAEVRRAQVANPILASVEILRANLIGDTLRVLLTLTLTAGNSTLGFSVVSPESIAQAARAGRTVQANQGIQSNEIVFVIKASEIPPPPPPAALPTVTVNGTTVAFTVTFTIARTGSETQSLLVRFSLTGDAACTLVTPPSPVTIPAGFSTVQVFMDSCSGGTQKLEIAPDPTYKVGSPGVASLKTF